MRRTGSFNTSLVLRIVLGLGVPLVAAVLWGVFAAPRSLVPVPVLSLVVKVVVFGSAVGALWPRHRPGSTGSFNSAPSS